MKQSGIGMRLYIQGHDVSGDVGAIGSITMTRAMLDVTNITEGAMERLGGLADGEVSFTCYFNPADGETHEYLATLPTSNVLVLVLVGTTRGDQVFAITGKQVNYNWSRGQDGSFVGTVQVQGADGVSPEWGELLVAKVTHASATDEDGLDGGASSASGGVGYLQHFSAATGTVEYDIEDSADDSTYTNLIGFTDVATPYDPIAQRVEVAGTVEQYVRASTNGTFTNAVFAMAFRRRQSTDTDAA